jgi:Tol biopolymer transport system component
LLPTSPGITQENFSWSADGSALFFNKGSIINGKYQVSLESVQINEEGSLMLFSSNDLGAIPRIALPSPDNNWLAYWSWDTITPFAEEQGLRVCLLELQTNQPGCTDLKTNPVPESIAWSAYGDIALLGEDPLGVSTSLVVVDASTKSIKNLLSFNNHSPLYPAWSPDGKFIAISAKPPDRPGQNGSPTPVAYITGRRLWIVNGDSGESHQLTRDALFSDERPMWSPDGKQLMFARLDEESASLWMVRSDGSGLRQVIPELTPRPEPAGQFAVVGWSALWDWWRPENR